MLFGFLGVKIQEVAQVAFLIIAAIVLLTFASSALAVMADRRSGEDEKKAMLEREHLALILTDALEAKRSASPESIAGSIADVLNDLVDASREVRGAAAQLSGASTGVGSFNESIEQLNVRIEYLSQQVALHVSAGVVQAIGDLGETVNTLNAAVSNDTTRLMGEVMQGLDDVRTQLARTSASVEFGAEQLRDTLKDIGDGCGGPSPSRP
jgi:flagellar biosynthesis chaperone FliJ